MRRAAAYAALAGVLSSACSTRYVGAPRTPDAVMPEVARDVVPEAGESVVTIDAEGGPAQVELITGRSQVTGDSRALSPRARGSTPIGNSIVYTRPLCQTPCAVSLPRGPRELRFVGSEPNSQRISTAWVNVGAEPTNVRHALGRQVSNEGIFIASWITMMAGGLALLYGVIGTSVGETIDEHGHRIDLRPSGLVIGASGLVALLAGGLTSYIFRPVHQPGSTVQWRASTTTP